MKLFEILDLAPHGPDTFVGAGPHYPWGGLYGGQIVAQALQASTSTVDPGFVVHSLRAYFIRRGDHSETVRYEVDRIRNGRSFCTRRVVARQSVGAILNLEASYHAPEEAADIETVSIPPGVPRPDELEQESWSPAFERAFVPAERMDLASRSGAGRAVAWLRVTGEIAPDDTAMHQGGLAYLSDDLPTDAVVRAHPMGREPRETLERVMFSASLDHAIWFHRPLRVDAWHLYDFTCQTYVGGRGLATGHVFDATGVHVATIAQEVLLRDSRESDDRFRPSLTGRQVYDLQITATEALMTLTSAQSGDIDDDADGAAALSPIERARALRPLIEANAERTELHGTMTTEVVAAIADAGLFWLLVPTEVGGLEADVATALEVFEELAYADGSTGWSAMANATTSCFASIYTADEAVRAMFGTEMGIHAGMLGPMGEATKALDGYRVTGRYQFGSGSGHANWLGAGVMEMVDGEPALSELGLPAMRVVFIPKERTEFRGNWDVMGLAGTGSFDYEVNDVDVPESFSFLLLEASPQRGGPGYGIGLFGLTAVGHAGFALGVGHRALDEVLGIAKAKQRLGAGPIADQQLFQHEFAMHDAAMRAARSYTYEAFAEAEAAVLESGTASVVEQQRMRQATTYATRIAADAARFAYTWAGSSGLRSPSVVQRCFRDIHAGTQHLYVDNNTLTGYTEARLAELPDPS